MTRTLAIGLTLASLFNLWTLASEAKYSCNQQFSAATCANILRCS